MKLFKKTAKTDRLETKALWRFIKVGYIVIAVIVMLITVDAAATRVNDCRNSNDASYVSTQSGSRIARNKLLENLQSGTKNCNEDEAQADAWGGVVITLIALMGGFFGTKAVCGYIILGSKSNKTNIV